MMLEHRPRSQPTRPIRDRLPRWQAGGAFWGVPDAKQRLLGLAVARRAIASARWFMLPRELSARDRPFCGTGPDHASDDELGALGLRRDVRSSPPGREQKAGQRQWVDAASPPRPGMGERTWR